MCIWIVGGWVPVTGMLAGMNLSKPGMNLSKPGKKHHNHVIIMITPTQQIVWSMVSRQPIADLSPTSRQPVADQLQPISNQLAINLPPVADRSSTGRRFLGNRKNAVLIAQWLHWLQLFFSRKADADRLLYMCDRGFIV